MTQINLIVDEPWDFPDGDGRTIKLNAIDSTSDDVWRVKIVSGWDDSKIGAHALLRPRHKGDTLRTLRDGQHLIVNLTTIAPEDNPGDRSMVIGCASISV